MHPVLRIAIQIVCAIPCALGFHTKEKKRSQIPFPGVQGTPIPTCIVCQKEFPPTFRVKDGEVEAVY